MPKKQKKPNPKAQPEKKETILLPLAQAERTCAMAGMSLPPGQWIQLPLPPLKFGPYKDVAACVYLLDTGEPYSTQYLCRTTKLEKKSGKVHIACSLRYEPLVQLPKEEWPASIPDGDWFELTPPDGELVAKNTTHVYRERTGRLSMAVVPRPAGQVAHYKCLKAAIAIMLAEEAAPPPAK